MPRALAAVQAARTLVLGPAGQAVLRRQARTAVPELERAISALGRSFGRHSTG